MSKKINPITGHNLIWFFVAMLIIWAIAIFADSLPAGF